MSPTFIEEYQLSDDTICTALLTLFAEGHKRGLTNDGVVGANDTVDPTTKKSIDLPLHEAFKVGPASLFKWPEYHNELAAFVEDYCQKYHLYKYVGKFYMKHLPQIQWYAPGDGFYKWHVDGGQDAHERAFVYMTYLNDVPDGGTEFMFQDITTTATKGKTLIWPAGLTHIHRGQISKEHHKYIITGWIYYDNEKD